MSNEENDLDLDERRANPDALKLYVMYDMQHTYLCAGVDPVEAAKNLIDAYGLREDSISVSQGFVLNNKFARVVNTEFGGLYLKRQP